MFEINDRHVRIFDLNKGQDKQSNIQPKRLFSVNRKCNMFNLSDLLDDSSLYLYMSLTPRCSLLHKIPPDSVDSLISNSVLSAETVQQSERLKSRSPITVASDSFSESTTSDNSISSDYQRSSVLSSPTPKVSTEAVGTDYWPHFYSSFPVFIKDVFTNGNGNICVLNTKMVQSFQSEMNNNSESNMFSNDSNETNTQTDVGNVSNNETNSKNMVENVRVPQMPFEELKARILTQLEFYFSQKNLASDAFLLGKMDSDYFVDIEILANFNMMRRLTNDCNLIKEVLKESTQLELSSDGNKVRPKRLKYGIVILREIRDDTPVEEIEKLFDNENCPKVLSCEFVHNASWYVMFESKEEANQAHRYLREQVKEFQGRPIMARVKSRSSIHSKINGHRNNAPPLVTQSMIMPFLTPTTIVSSYNNINLIGATTASLTVPTNSPGVPNFSNLPNVNSSVQQVPTPMFDPVQQRLVYPNNSNHGGASLPVHVYNYYAPPSVMQWSGPGQPNYVDFGSMFAFNGLAPHTSYSTNSSAQTSSTFVNSTNTSMMPASTVNTTNTVSSLRPPAMIATASSGAISGSNNFGNSFNQRNGGKASRNLGQVTMFSANSYQRTNSSHYSDNNNTDNRPIKYSTSSVTIRKRKNHDDSNNSHFHFNNNHNNNHNPILSNFVNSGGNRPITTQHYYSNNNYNNGHFKSQTVKEKDSTFDLERAKFPPLRLSSDHVKNVANDDNNIQSINYDSNFSSFVTKESVSDNVTAEVFTNTNKMKAKDITTVKGMSSNMKESDNSTGIKIEKGDNDKSSSISATDSFPTAISPSVIINDVLTTSVEALSLTDNTNKEDVVSKNLNCIVNHSGQVIDTKDAATLTNCDNESNKVMYVSRVKKSVSNTSKTEDKLSDKQLLERSELNVSKLIPSCTLNTKNASTMTVNHTPPTGKLITVTNVSPLAVNDNNNCGNTITTTAETKNNIESVTTKVGNDTGCKLPSQLTYVPTVSLNDANNNIQISSNNDELIRNKSPKMSYAQVIQNNLNSKEEYVNKDTTAISVNPGNSFGHSCNNNGNQNDSIVNNSTRGSKDNSNTTSSNGSLDSAAPYQQNSSKRSYQKGYKSNNRNYKQSKSYSSNNKSNNSTSNRSNNRQSKKHSS